MPNKKVTTPHSDIDLIINRLLLVLPSKQEIQAMEQRLDKKYDRTINLLDKIAGNLQKMQQELVLVEGHKDQLENHEDRIATLESSITTAN